MTKNYKKKLIEVAIPLEAINAASAYEKMPGIGPHPRGLHQYWARRPLVACRAVLFAQLVDDPSERVDELFHDEELKQRAEKELAERLAKREQDRADGKAIPADSKPVTLEQVIVELERQRLFSIIEDLSDWKNSSNERVLETARAEIRRSCGNDVPPVYDPFSGGGSIPLEAQRLGVTAYGSDLNPVAVMISKAMVELPVQFRGMEPVHPGAPDRNEYRNTDGIAEDVKYYGDLALARATSKMGNFYPSVSLPPNLGGGQARVIAWIWARTVPSPDPAFADAHVPIASTFLLSTKKGKEAWIEPIIDKGSKTISYQIHKGGTKDELSKAKEGTKAGRGANFRCLLSDTAITPDHIAAAGKAGNLHQALIAIVADGPGGRIYLPPDQTHEEIAKSVVPDWKPEQRQPENPRWFSPPAYGMETFGDLFTARQLAGLTAISDAVISARDEIEKDAISSGQFPNPKAAREYASSVAVYLCFAVNRCADFNNSIVRWNPSNEKVMNLFGRQAIPMTYDFGEANLFENVVGGFKTTFEFVSACVEKLCPTAQAKISQLDAQSVKYPDNAVISTDPPYYDNIGYADLSDFFYVWMKRILKDVYPDIFGSLATPKREELVATPYRHGGKAAAEEFFLDGMRAAMKQMAEQADPRFPTTIYYAFKQSEIAKEGISSTGWATFLQAVIEAGFSVLGTLPIRSEQAYRMVATGTNALANSVVLVCRAKDRGAEVISRAEFIRALKRELPSTIVELQAGNIAPADMPQAAIGPGMGVFSRYQAVLEADDSPMTVKTALQLINRELDEFLSDVQGEFDPDTRFAITWFEQNGMLAGEYGTANNIATARGISVESVKHAGIVESSAGKVRILRRDELPADWSPETDTHLTVWECCQYVIHKIENEGEYEAAILLKKMGPDKADAVKDLAYCLYDICSNKRKDAKEATSYNGLIAIWSELTRQAASIHDIDIGGDRQTSLNL